MITVSNQQKDLPLSLRGARAVLSFLLDEFGVKTDELRLRFVTDRTMRLIHAEFFSDPSPTDSMSFPIDSPENSVRPHVLGEILVCPKTALDYVQKKGGDPYLELILYIVHGFLHLIGYDDLDPVSRKKMRAAEKRCLGKIHTLFPAALEKRCIKIPSRSLIGRKKTR